jgi:peptide/nickel transport system ATP-binding protein
MADFIKVLRYGEEVEQAPTRKMLKAAGTALHQVACGPCGRWKSRKSRAKTSFSRQHVDASLWRVGQGIARRQHFDAARANRCGRRRIRLRQIDNGTGDYRTAAASAGQVVFNGEPLPAALKDRSKEQLQKHPDDLPDGRHGDEPAQTVRKSSADRWNSISGSPARHAKKSDQSCWR